MSEDKRADIAARGYIGEKYFEFTLDEWRDFLGTEGCPMHEPIDGYFISFQSSNDGTSITFSQRF